MLCMRIHISPLQRADASAHKHLHTEIILTLMGDGTDRVEGKSIPFTAGSILVVDPGVLHERLAGENGFQDTFLAISDSSPLAGLRGRVFHDDANKTMEKLFLAAYGLYNRDEPESQSLVDQLVGVICRILQNDDARERPGSLADRIRNTILLRFTDPQFCVGDALRDCGYSEDYARRAFTGDLGVSPSAYLEARRLDCARTLLLQHTDPPRSVGEIALMSGYFDANYFSRVFHRKFGVSPTAFRSDAAKD